METSNKYMYISHVKNMKTVKTLTLMSLVNKVSEFFLKSNKQDGKRPKPNLRG